MISYTVGTAYTYGVAFPPDWGRRSGSRGIRRLIARNVEVILVSVCNVVFLLKFLAKLANPYPAKDARLLWLTLGTTRRHDEWEIGAGGWGERERRKKKLGKTICQ